MVRVRVGVDDVAQLEPELAQHRHVAVLLLAHRVDEDGLLCRLATHDVGECATLRVEELREDEGLHRGEDLAVARSLAGRHPVQPRQQPLAHWPAIRAAGPKLEVAIPRELLRGLDAVAVLLHEPEEQEDARSVPAAALQHQGPGQPVHRVQGGFHLLICWHGQGRARNRQHLHVIHRGKCQLFGIKVRVGRLVQEDPGLVPRSQVLHHFGGEVAAQADVAGDHGNLNSKLVYGDVSPVRGEILG
mmetsp:Transcript_82169/g.230526  ORF Transcript_82169/g.230526 Transcript_82169/m.230526 type:complete len:245 (-) Transcript_82169:103-837(-)